MYREPIFGCPAVVQGTLRNNKVVDLLLLKTILKECRNHVYRKLSLNSMD